VLVTDLQTLLERLAPSALAESWDNVGLLVGDERAAVCRILVSLELTEAVLAEALAAGCDTILTHHPLLFSPVRTLAESHPRERMLRRVVAEHMTLIACHTNLDCAPGGIADIAGRALGLVGMRPLQMAQAGWCKLVGFVPASAIEKVAAAVFAAGGGGIGNYKDCAFAGQGTGWFTPLPGSAPTIGEVSRPERTPEVRWETVVPRSRLGAAVRAFVESHPYEEPAFDVYAVEDVLPRVGLGRVGTLPRSMRVDELAELVRTVFELRRVSFSGDGSRVVARVGILPGGGRSLVEQARNECEVLVTGDLSYHMGEQAAEYELSLIDTSHGELEWWAFQRWAGSLADVLAGEGVSLAVSREWRSPWTDVRGELSRSDITSEANATKVDDAGPAAGGRVVARAGSVRIWIDGGSRGNPGPSAIGVVIEDGDGEILQTVSRVIGIGTNNVAEYKALLTGLDAAERLGAQVVEVVSDSELLVRQMRGEYKVRNEGLKPLYDEARARAAGFCGFSIRHVERNLNARADALVNQALDGQAKP
jgi:dinuclear metal center YbgI/SA1388 family protein